MLRDHNPHYTLSGDCSLLYVSLRIHNASSDSINRHFVKNDDCNSVDFLRELLYVNTEKSSKLQYKQEQFPIYVAVIEGVV